MAVDHTAWANEVRRLAMERDALIIAHNYQVPQIQDIADHVGDSLYLSRIAATAPHSEIVFCGVHFMAETAKILSPTSACSSGRRGRLFPGRHDHRRPAARVEGRAPRRRGRRLRQHQRGGQGRDRYLLHLLERRGRHTDDSGRPGHPLPARPAPR